MDMIDPESPLQIGIDTNDQPVELGEYDSEGAFVGYIDADSVAWASRRERDTAIGGAELIEAWRRWNKTGGVLGREPDAADLLERAQVLPENQDAAIEFYHLSLNLSRLLSAPAANRRAMNN